MHSVSAHHSPHLVFFPFCSKYLCNDVISLFSFGFFPLVDLERDKLTHSLYCTETRQPVCINHHTKCSVVVGHQSAPLLEKFTKAL